MVKKKLLVLVSVALALLLMLPVAALAGRATQDTGRGTVSLRARGDAPENATGIVNFRVRTRANGVTHMRATFTVDNLPKKGRLIYAAWMVDNEGNVQPLTAFNTDNSGHARATTVRDLVSVAPFVRVTVTRQRKQGFSTQPSETLVLSGTFP